MQSQKQDVREDVREPDNRQGSAATPVRNVQPISAGHSGPADRRNAVQHKPFIRRALNRVLHLLCRFVPGATTLRPFLHRMRGMQIGNNVWIGDDAYLENEFPEQVEIHDGAVVGLRAIVIAHTRGTGRIIIGKDVYIGAGAVIVTVANRTLVIGEGSVVMASSLVTGSVAPYTLYGSDASKPLARITKPFTASTTYEEFMTTLRPLSD
jgi:acetyltransferase-like isoleucine patch superfamily enzyme